MLKELLRFNYLRNHYIRFKWSGVALYLRLYFFKQNGLVKFKTSEFKYPVFLRPGSSDIETFYKVLFNLDYEVSLEKKPQVIIDLGANIGLASVFFLNKYPGAKVIAVEPEESNFEVLKNNTKNYNGFFSYKNAVWNKPAHLEIVENKLGKWAFTVQEAVSKTASSIEALTIGQIMAAHSIKQIDILKIDIEGSELELFSSGFEQWLPYTKTIIIELHDWMREGCSKQFFTTLTKYDFRLSHKGENMICYMK